MYQQHVIDWWKHKGYRVTVLSDWSLMCISESAMLEADQERLSDAIQRRHAARWKRTPSM